MVNIFTSADITDNESGFFS